MPTQSNWRWQFANAGFFFEQIRKQTRSSARLVKEVANELQSRVVATKSQDIDFVVDMTPAVSGFLARLE